MSSPSPSRAIDKFLLPIPGAHPSGESLRYEGTYDRIAAARREDDPTLTQGVWKKSLKRADWNEVQSLCAEALQTRTKDLQIAAWLLEAWLHLYGFPGLHDGLELLRELSSRFWADLHPQPRDGDLEYRTAPISWINEKLSIQLKLLPITSPEGEEIPAYCWADWENACRPEVNDPKLRPPASAAQNPKLTTAEFQKAVMFTPTLFLSTLSAGLEVAMESCTALESSLDQLCGKQAPSLRQFFGVLESIHGFVATSLVQRQPAEPEYAPQYSPPPAAASEDPPLAAPVFYPGPIASRDDAYRRLAEAADYLARIEPHSPAPYLVRRAILWGSMSLPDLLRELVRNDSELNEIYRLLELGDWKKTPK
ncbi:MAG TPA: type VI secretion system protein TssA [Bryobacteraceae bacterium]|nr:type VI secretion system protein TssA [Bryobacteraceae bacterium]